MAVMIEKPNRRASLAFYVANVASEALFRIYVARGYMRTINNGQVYIFSIAIATIMLLAKKHGFEDDPLSAAIKLIVGSEEASKRQRKRTHDTILREQEQLVDEETEYAPGEQQIAKSNSDQESASLMKKAERSYYWIKALFTSRHKLCPHQDCSCFYYVCKSATRALFIGYSAQLGLKLFTRASQLLINPKLALDIATSAGVLQVGLFLSTFSGLYKATCCSLRRISNNSTPLNCFIAGLVAGPALFIYPSPTVALYVLWKCLETLFHEAVRKKVIKNKNLFIVILYGLATSQLFYSALMDPRYMKKSYMAFLDRISQHKLHMVNRSVLDVFGTEASSGYEDFFPDLHPKFMSHAFLGSIWIWMIEQKFVAKQVASF